MNFSDHHLNGEIPHTLCLWLLLLRKLKLYLSFSIRLTMYAVIWHKKQTTVLWRVYLSTEILIWNYYFTICVFLYARNIMWDKSSDAYYCSLSFACILCIFILYRSILQNIVANHLKCREKIIHTEELLKQFYRRRL